ncbi:Vps62-related protein [Pyxidicoccus parkwayensis]|nr:Vps62-related protein [Pyxidicoccus parkwaysis]
MVNAMILTSNEFDLIWNDKGSGAKASIQTWRAAPKANGYLPLGDLAQAADNTWIYGTKPLGAFVVLQDVSTDGDVALKNPESFTNIWTDAGSGGNTDGSIWAPNPPNGFTALGHMVNTGHSTPPDTSSYYCINTQMVVQAQSGPLIYADTGSGAKKDLGVWSFAPTPTQPGGIVLGTFLANNSHSAPPENSLFDLIDPQYVTWVTATASSRRAKPSRAEFTAL